MGRWCWVYAGACSITGAACTSSAQCSAVSTASSNATCSDLLSDYSKTLLADALSNGVVCRMNNRDYNNAAAGRFNYPDNTYNFPVTGGIGVETIWIDDALPAGAFPAGWYDNWTWVNNAPKPYSGTVADQSALQAGMHYHYYFGGPLFPVNSGDLLSQWVYLDPNNPPTEIQLWWYDQTGSWEHRAYWGSNVLLYGNDGTVSRRYMGPLPPTGKWVRLVVPAANVGLEGMSVNGILLMENDGRVTYDRIKDLVSI